jgi:hypothetical protein
MTSSIKNCVIIHYMLGLGINSEWNDAAVLSMFSTMISFDIFLKLMKDPLWADPRDGYFDSVDDDLDSLPAPWTLGWTGALTVPKSLFYAIGGFDEVFSGWGVEDIDFSYRLWKTGASFSSMRDCPSLHIPHPTESLEKKMSSNRENMKRFHRKNYQFETEMYYLYSGPYCNQVISRFNHLVITHLIPKYSMGFLRRVNSEIEINGILQKSLLIGIDQVIVASALNVNHIFVFNKTILT